MLRTKLALALLLTSIASTTLAQSAPDDLPPAPPPPPAASAAPAPDAPNAVPGPAAPACMPACRSGFTCVQGQCVSACNPPCGAGQQCTAQGECASTAPPRAPTFPGGSESPIAPPPAAGKERHDGFMLRLALGFGGASMKEELALQSAGTTTDEISGFSGSFSVDVGAALTDAVVLHARLSDFVIVDPKIKVGGVSATAKNTSFGALLFGPALSYYFMPVNIYLTAALGLSWLQFQNQNGDSAASKVGPGLNIDIGKEWWVSDNWGLGVAARFWYTHVQGKESGSSITPLVATPVSVSYKDDFLAFGVLFSATYQ